MTYNKLKLKNGHYIIFIFHHIARIFKYVVDKDFGFEKYSLLHKLDNNSDYT